MSGYAGLVGCLVDRLTTRLPYRTGTVGLIEDDNVLRTTRAMLVDLSSAAFGVIAESILDLLEDLARPYVGISTHPPHVVLSEIYLMSTLADCCSPYQTNPASSTQGQLDSPPAHPVLGEALVNRMFEAFRELLEPLSEQHVLPSQNLLEHMTNSNANVPPPDDLDYRGSNGLSSGGAVPFKKQDELDVHVKKVVEFVTATNWSSSFAHLKAALFNIRINSSSDLATDSSVAPQLPERLAPVIIRLLSFFHVDGSKVGLVIQEICSNYLHFSKSCQNAVAFALPLFITGWLDRHPQQFVQLHVLRKKLDGGADTLFDMINTNAGPDGGKRKLMLFSLQLGLLLLLPEVFEVASGMKDTKSNSVVKKVAFLDGLRKALRAGNERAGYCLVTLLRAARHFKGNTENAFVIYAMDVQDEVKAAIFKQQVPPLPDLLFSQDMITSALIGVASLNHNGGIDILLDSCTASNAPVTLKIAVVQASSYLVTESSPDAFKTLLEKAIPFMRAELQHAYAGAKQIKGSSGQCKDDVIASIVQFLYLIPDHLLDELINTPLETGFLRPFLFCVLSSDSVVREMATKLAAKLSVEGRGLPVLRTNDQSALRHIQRNISKLGSKVVMDLCERIATQHLIFEIKTLRDLLMSRLTLIKLLPGLSPADCNDPEAISASSRLETSLLISLCTTDVEICQAVTACFRLLLEEETISKPQNGHNDSIFPLVRNQAVYQELASPAFRFTGLVAFQKRMRSILRKLHYPTIGILNAWEGAFKRWLDFAKSISSSSAETLDESMFSEWRNLSGFLASLGGICTADQGNALDDPAASGLRWIDQQASEQSEEPSLTRFLKSSIQILGCSNPRVREAMRDVLSSEIAFKLFYPLFKTLESELDVILGGDIQLTEQSLDSEVVLAEQAASLLKSMLDRTETPKDLGASFVHLGVISLNFTKFIDSAPDGLSSLRVKIRICNLCEAVTKRREHMSLRDDVRTRNRLLEIIAGWIARPPPFPQDQSATSGTWQNDSRRIQKDLDKACLTCLAQLTFRLPLQPADVQSDAGMSAQKAQMFQSYFNRFLSLLHVEPRSGLDRSGVSSINKRGGIAPESDSVITILSNLLSANIDVGLKHSLNIGYHENIEIRTAFVRVLYNILLQGTEFGSLTDLAVSEKYEELLDVLTTDLSIAVSMSAICPTSEVDELTVCFLTIFEQRGLIFELFEVLIKHEIEQTGKSNNETEVLRRTCVVTKMLSIYARWKGNSYLRTSLQKVLERLMLTSQELDLELDPTRVGSPEELRKNAVQLQIVAKVFMDDICASSASVPASFRNICSIISEAVSAKFPNAKYTAVGAFIFLRFICPAIVAPETEGLVSTTPTKEMRRGLLLIAKIIQNLANNVLFGAKEPYMFPLNPFLVSNINFVMSFLRDVSVPPEHLESRTNANLLDFGSCVALHRFLYDHWDYIRQTLLWKGRQGHTWNTVEVAQGASPVPEPLQSLFIKLGPPPLAISWNRPQISLNSPPVYSRFQNFMLRNAFKSLESFLTSRAVYDGGESKDGLSIICVILRHIENENIEFDTLLYCYLKIASRLWHEPFGLLIDATCYKGRSEPPDDFFTKLDLLTPAELSLSLSRIYVYNMNSAFKRCLRRLLRVATRNDNSVFHPKNAEYHLFGSLQDLQAQFHLSQLHLPKETISVVTDTRFVFQPVTRLSKSKGMVEVIIKVGSQFVQVTTAQKQEILPGLRLSSTINDIFRWGDVEEATTTMSSGDESTFGLKADGGRIVMCFTSSKRNDVLQSIRGAKGKYGRDERVHKPLERLVRPQDVPGTILNLALMNLASPDHTLRLTSYNLLGALCRAFEFRAGARIICAKDLSVPLDSFRFIVGISKELAKTEPQLTADFLTEFFVGWQCLPEEQKPLGLEYMAPWISGLRISVLAGDVDGEKSREKVVSLFRKFIDLVALDPTLVHALEHLVWPTLAQDEVLLDIFFDELIKTALNQAARGESLESVSSVMVGIGTISIRSRLISRLRKALNRSSLRPTRFLPDNSVWAEICVLLELCISLSFDSGVQAQTFLPEIFHIVSILSNTGGQDVRLLVQKLLVNTVHAACSSFLLDDARMSRVRGILDLLCGTHADTLLALPVRDEGHSSSPQDTGLVLVATENLASMLSETCSAAAPSVYVANVWLSRWMSLVASTAFQNNPAIQPKAFTVLGYLAREEVDDDLLYQVLVALRCSVSQFGEDGNGEMLVSIIMSLSKLVVKLPSASRYGLQLFWIALSLVRLLPTGLFACTSRFLEAILTTISAMGSVKGDKMVSLLMQSHGQLGHATCSLDDAYGIHFSKDRFHFAVCASLIRGLNDAGTRPTAIRVLTSFIELTIELTDTASDSTGSDAIHGSPYSALILARCANEEDLLDGLLGISTHSAGGSSTVQCRGIDHLETVDVRDLLLISALELVNFQALDDMAQARTLEWMNKLAQTRRDVFVDLCGAMPSILDDVLLHGQDSAALNAAHSLLRTLTSDRQYVVAMRSVQAMRDILDENGFGGLWKYSSQRPTDDARKERFELTAKLIELIVV
ncbi:hypothetical protein HIM_01663 [Hirsutella minnesotensis 3608]|nr:hypothetical protein HIM_01663 [Hirsutella minnesotensis 3608]